MNKKGCYCESKFLNHRYRKFKIAKIANNILHLYTHAAPPVIGGIELKIPLTPCSVGLK